MKLKHILFICFMLFFLANNLSMVSNIAGNANYAFLIISIFLICIIHIKFDLNYNYLHMVGLLFFAIIMLLSYWMHPLGQSFSFIVRLTSFLYLTVICMRSLIVDKREFMSLILYSAFFSSLPLLIINTGVYLSSGMMEGIFSNPNGLGMFSSTVFILSIIVCYLSKRPLIFVISFFATILSFYLTVVSHSRTNFVVIIVALLTIGIAILYSKHNKKGVFWKRILLFPTFIIGIFGVYNLWAFIDINIIDKFQRKADSGDVLDHRTTIWQATIKDRSLFGYGEDYFINLFGQNAHNTFLHLLGSYGYLVFIISVLFCGVIFLKFFALFVKSKDIIYIIPIVFLINFLIVSMAETVLFKMNMTIVFLMIGILYAGKLDTKREEFPIVMK